MPTPDADKGECCFYEVIKIRLNQHGFKEEGMKRLLTIFSSVFFLFCISVLPAAADSKIGIVDIQLLQQESSQFQKVRDQLQKRADELKAKLSRESSDLAKLEEEYEKQSMMLSLDAKETKRRELEKKKRYYNYLFEEYNRELKEAEMEATRAMSKQIRTVLSSIGKSGGFTVILDASAPGLLYEKGAVDITKDVIKALDRQ
jgi:outer membrane protein